MEALDPHEFEAIRDNFSLEKASKAGELDAVLVGRRPDGTQAYAAIEASVTLDSDDLTRVKERAEILTWASSMPVLALAVTDNKPTLVLMNQAKSLNVAISRKSQRFDVDALFNEPPESGGSKPGIAI